MNILDDTLQKPAQKTTVSSERIEHESNDKRKLGSKQIKQKQSIFQAKIAEA